VRRRLGICALAAGIVIVLGMALSLNHLATVSAAGGSGNLELTAVPLIAGCPLGPSFTFCDQIPNGSSQTVEFNVTPAVAVTNVSVSLAAIPGLSSNFAPGDFTLGNLSTCSGSLAANQPCVISLTFSPTQAGLREAMLTVTDAAGDNLVINVGGTGTTFRMTLPLPPACQQEPGNAFSYCDEAVGGASGAETFTLASGNAITGLNVGFAAVTGLESEFDASKPDFTIESTTCTGTLAAFASCTVSVSFTPKTAGLREAALTATDSQGDSLAVTLAGHTNTGLEFSQQGTFLPCLPSPGFHFCNTPVGGMSQQVAFNLTNTSGVQLTGLSVPTTPAGSNFTIATTSCVSVLAVAASCTINVEFTPQASGLLQGAISVTDDAGDIGAANFAGTGDDYGLQLAGGQQIELTIVQGGTAVFNGQVQPDNVFGQDGESVQLVCPPSSTMPSNTSCVISPCQAAITPGTAVPFTITFVTSSATSVAPVPPQSTGCTSYGPPPTSMIAPEPHSRDPLGGRRFPPPLRLASFAAFAVFLGWLSAATKGHLSRERMPMIFALAGFAAMILVGCHHGNSTIIGPATSVGTESMIVTGKPVDSNGNSLNTSRPMPQIMLDVVAQPTGGGGFP